MEAHAIQILLGCMKVEFAMELTSQPRSLHLHLGVCQLHLVARLLR
jgi:hypothetical protein